MAPTDYTHELVSATSVAVPDKVDDTHTVNYVKDCELSYHPTNCQVTFTGVDAT